MHERARAIVVAALVGSACLWFVAGGGDPTVSVGLPRGAALEVVPTTLSGESGVKGRAESSRAPVLQARRAERATHAGRGRSESVDEVSRSRFRTVGDRLAASLLGGTLTPDSLVSELCVVAAQGATPREGTRVAGFRGRDRCPTVKVVWPLGPVFANVIANRYRVPAKPSELVVTLERSGQVLALEAQLAWPDADPEATHRIRVASVRSALSAKFKVRLAPDGGTWRYVTSELRAVDARIQQRRRRVHNTDAPVALLVQDRIRACFDAFLRVYLLP